MRLYDVVPEKFALPLLHVLALEEVYLISWTERKYKNLKNKPA